MKQIAQQITALAVIVSLVSCGGNQMTAKQAALIQTTSLPMPTKNEKAYKQPNYHSASSQQTANNIAMTSGLAGGLVGGLVGGLIVGGVQVAQQKTFEGKNSDHISVINQKVDHSIEDDVQKSLNRYLGYNAFFAKRMKPSSPTPLLVEVTNFGLTRVNVGKEQQFSAAVNISAYINDPEGKKVLNTSAQGTSTVIAPLSQFASDKKLLDKSFREASDSAASALAEELKKATEKVQ